ncbi:DUF1353 domain-containing protein [Paraburkholderia graminis]|uniref:DUF1353 domain-containing protein n=1 Tax=Paraburkholderia graminis TaxID=60548 RepID=UPI0038BC7396
MSAFLTALQVENATGLDDGKWRLTAPLVYRSDVAKMTITAPAGMVTDFASVPRAPLAYMLFGDRASEASVIHDFLYGSHLVPRSVADAVLREASAVTGVSWFARNSMWLGVRLFGGSHWTPKPTAA